MFGYLIPGSYKEALEFDRENYNIEWADATWDEMDCIKEQQVFTKHQRVKWDSNHKQIINAPPNHPKIRVNLVFAVKHDGGLLNLRVQPRAGIPEVTGIPQVDYRQTSDS